MLQYQYGQGDKVVHLRVHVSPLTLCGRRVLSAELSHQQPEGTHICGNCLAAARRLMEQIGQLEDIHHAD